MGFLAHFQTVSIWAALIAAVSVFMLGGAWYSPALFLKPWFAAQGMKEEDGNEKHGATPFVISFFMSLIAAVLFGALLGPRPGIQNALGYALIIGLGWVATSFGINYSFAGKSPKLWLIDAGYHVPQFLVYALVFGLWGLLP